MYQEKNVLELIKKLKEFENKEAFLPFVEDNIFDSDSEIFYMQADTHTQIFIYELIFELERIFYSNYNDQDLFSKVNDLGYPITPISQLEMETQDGVYSNHRFKIKTAICDIVF